MECVYKNNFYCIGLSAGEVPGIRTYMIFFSLRISTLTLLNVKVFEISHSIRKCQHQ